MGRGRNEHFQSSQACTSEDTLVWKTAAALMVQVCGLDNSLCLVLCASLSCALGGAQGKSTYLELGVLCWLAQ